MANRMMDGLNEKERKVLGAFLRRGRPSPKSIEELARICWSAGRGMTSYRAASWVRNSLRRLVASTLLEQVDEGVYQITEFGREVAKKGLV